MPAPSKEKIKILYVITKSNWGGAQAYVYHLATHLPKKYEPVVALGGNGPLKQKLDEAGIRTISLPFLERDVGVFRDFVVFIKLFSLFRAERPRIVHLNSSKIGGLGSLAGRLARVPNIIFTAHGWAFREERPALQKALIKFLSWITILWSHSVITVSERDRREALSFPFVKQKIVLIYNGIREPELLSPEEARRKIFSGGGTAPLWVGTIGELHKNKGHMYALNALSGLLKNNDLSLFIIGEGEERAALEQAVANMQLHSNVTFVGARDDAPSLLFAFDIFLFPSVKEGLPYAVLEAGMAGLPVIASAVGGIPEIITDMESGILVRPKNSEEMLKAVEYLLAHPKDSARFGKKLRSNVKKNFSFPKMLRETLVVYRDTEEPKSLPQ